MVDLDELVADPISPNLIRADLTVDGLHFNATGYEKVAWAVFEALKTKRKKPKKWRH